MSKGERQIDSSVFAVNESKVKSLESVSLGSSNDRDESDLQQIIHDNPELLKSSVERIGNNTYTPLKPIWPIDAEISLESGFTDGIFVSPNGNLTVIETKLVDNPEAKRKVNSQILEYAKDLSRLDYNLLSEKVSNAFHRSDVENINRHEEFDLYNYAIEKFDYQKSKEHKKRFISNIRKSLSDGEFLLLIIGDQIRPEAEALTNFMKEHIGMKFSLGIVELRFYKINNQETEIVIPNVPMRTEIVERSIITHEFKLKEDDQTTLHAETDIKFESTKDNEEAKLINWTDDKIKRDGSVLKQKVGDISSGKTDKIIKRFVEAYEKTKNNGNLGTPYEQKKPAFSVQNNSGENLFDIQIHPGRSSKYLEVVFNKGATSTNADRKLLQDLNRFELFGKSYEEFESHKHSRNRGLEDLSNPEWEQFLSIIDGIEAGKYE